MPKLVFIGEPFAGRTYELTLEKTAVGRGDQNTLALHDPSVSLVHGEILVYGPEVIVHDLGSANGTFVAGVRVRQQSPVKHGQVVRFGSVEARLELDSPVPEESGTGLDTIHLMRVVMRDQKREEQKPKPADPTMKLDPGAGSEPVEHTVLLRRTTSSQEEAVPPEPPKPVIPPRRVSVLMVVVTVVALALGLALLLWLLR